MLKYEVVIKKPNGKEEVIHKNLTLKEAIEYFENINNTYYRKMEQATMPAPEL
jgi:hypothetical protein